MRRQALLAILLTVAVVFPRWAAADTYVGRGSANVTAPGDTKQAALEEALRDAVRKAIEKRLGPDALLDNEGTIEDEILIEARSYVVRFTEKDSRQRGTRLRVTVEAEIDDERIGKMLTNLRLLQATVDMPRIMIIHDPDVRWDEEQARRVENQFIKLFTEKKFNVFETGRAREISALAQRALQFSEYAERAPMPGDQLAQKLIAEYECDAVVLYSVQESAQGTAAGFHTYETAVQARVYTRDRAQYLAADEQAAAKPGGTEYQSKLASAEAATKKVVEYMSQRIISWWRDFRDLMPINLSLYMHRSHLGRVVELKARIERIVGVHSLNQRRMVSNPRDDSAWVEYQVNYRGRVDAFTAALWKALESEERDYKLLPMTFGNNVTVQIIDPQQQQYDEAFWRKKVSERAALAGGDVARVVDQTIDGVVVIRTYVDLPVEPPAPPDQPIDQPEDTPDDGSQDEPDDRSQDDNQGDAEDGGKGDDTDKSPDGVRVKVEVEVEVGKDLAVLDTLAGSEAKPKARAPHSSGSGFIVGTDGRIVTNYHVVAAKMAGCEGSGGTIPPDDVHLVVTLHDGRKRVARVIRGNEARDLAILKIDCDNLEPLELGDSDKAVVGQPIVLIGHPLDATRNAFTVTNGIIAARRPAFLQISALAHPGNSGGPMMDMKGRVLGILTQGDVVLGMGADGQPERIAQQGTARCVPANDAKILLGTP